MTPRPDPFTEIREALRQYAKLAESPHRWDATRVDDERAKTALAALETLKREAAERETALKRWPDASTEVAYCLRERKCIELRAAEARVREVEAERDRLKDATSGLANAAESFIHSFSGHIGESYFTADTLTRSIARARAVLAAALPAVDAPPQALVCPKCGSQIDPKETRTYSGTIIEGFCTTCKSYSSHRAVDAPPEPTT